MTAVMTTVTNRSIPRDELRQRIYAAAIQLFREKGYGAATVEEIARSAGVAKGTLFNFFPAKGAILLAHYQTLDERYGAAMERLSPERPKASLVRLYRDAEALLRPEGDLARAMFEEIGRDARIGEADLDSGKRDRERLREFFRACRKAGTVARHADAAVAAEVVADLFGANVTEWLRQGMSYSLADRLAAKLECVFKGLAPVTLALWALAMALPRPGLAAEPQEPAMIELFEDERGAVGLVPFAEFGPGQFLIDYQSGRAGALSASAEGLVLAKGLRAGGPGIGTLRRDGPALEASYDGARRVLRKVPIASKAFTVGNGEASLAGVLLWRSGVTWKGSVVIVHGSNDSPRTSYGPWVAYLVSRGWRVAVYDKRGSGESTGDWRRGSFVELASDARAVRRLALGEDGARREKVGMLGISQAGWVMPLAAQDGAFDFIVSLAGPGVTPERQTLDLVSAQLEAYGFTGESLASALDYYRLDLAVTKGERGFAELQAAFEQAQAQKAEWLLAAPLPADAPERGFLARIAAFDVLPHWAKLHLPVLAIYGGKDLLVPPAPNRRLVERALGRGARRLARTVVLPRVNHLGMIATTGTFAEYAKLERWDPAYFATFGDWLDAQAAP
jgi:AcrR family transcriptional regulator